MRSPARGTHPERDDRRFPGSRRHTTDGSRIGPRSLRRGARIRALSRRDPSRAPARSRRMSWPTRISGSAPHRFWPHHGEGPRAPNSSATRVSRITKGAPVSTWNQPTSRPATIVDEQGDRSRGTRRAGEIRGGRPIELRATRARVLEGAASGDDAVVLQCSRGRGTRRLMSREPMPACFGVVGETEGTVAGVPRSPRRARQPRHRSITTLAGTTPATVVISRT